MVDLGETETLFCGASLLAELVSGVKSDEIAARLKALGKSRPDPRISSHYVKMLAKPPFTAGSSRGMWNDILTQLMSVHADPRTPARLRLLEPDYLTVFGATVMGKYMKAQLPLRAQKTEDALAGREVATEAELTAIEGIRASLPSATPATVEVEVPKDDHLYFWGRIAEDPADPGRRSEYRSWLAARNDPRAEFIEIQESKVIHGRLPPAQKAREQKLLAAHQMEWMGPIAKLVARPVFERGFLDSGGLTPKSTLTGQMAGHPLWATVRELWVSYNNEQGHGVVLHPVMKSLRTLTSVNASLLEILFRADAPPRPLERIHTWADIFLVLHEKQMAPGLPQLKTLDFSDEWRDKAHLSELVPVWSSPVMARLEHIHFNTRLDPESWLHFLRTLVPNSVQADIQIRDSKFARGPDGKYSVAEITPGADAKSGNLYSGEEDFLKRVAKVDWAKLTVKKPEGCSDAEWKKVEKIFKGVPVTFA
jgi:hypothetical protein